MSISESMGVFLNIRANGAAAAGSQVRDLASTNAQAASRVAGSWTNAGTKIRSVWGDLAKVGMMVGGWAFIRSAINDVAAFDSALTEMRLTAGLTAAETAKIKKQIMDLSTSTLQLPEDQLAAFKDMVAAGIDPRQAIQGLEAINRTATASFSDVRDIAASTTDLLQKMQIDPSKLERTFNIMAQGGKEGKFELKDMARFFPQVASDAARFGMVGEHGLSQMVAMLQISRKGTADASTAANNMRNFFGHITAYRGAFKKLGIDVWSFLDPKTGKFKSKEHVDSFFKEISSKSKGSVAMLEVAGIRDVQAKDFIAQMMMNWKEYEQIRDKSLKSADAGVVAKDFDVVKDTTASNIKKMEIEKSKLLKDDKASTLAGTVSEKGSKAISWAAEHPGAALGIAAGAWKVVKWALGKFRGTGGAKALGGLGMGGGKLPMPVYVVNKHLSMLPGSWGGEAAGGAAEAAKRGMLGRAKDLAASGWRVLRAPVGAAAIGTTTDAAAAAGAVGYGIGTLIDKGLTKAFGGVSLGEKLYDWFNPEKLAGKMEVKSTVPISIQINDGRLTAISNDPNTRVEPTIRRGRF